MHRLGALAFLLLPVLPLHAQENVPPASNVDHKLLALRIAEEFAEPRYGVLLTRMQAQEAAWTEFCAAEPEQRNFSRLTEQFANAVNAWSSVELLRYGPVSDGFRYERIAYWPERKNDVERGLRRMLSESDVLTPDAMSKKSVAVQGLPALERLLYEGSARDALVASGNAQKRRCAAGVAISGNLKNVIQDIVNGWAPAKDQIRADDTIAREVVTRFATDLLTVYQVVGDLKLDAVMGKTAADVKPKAAQWWRSGLSSQTIALNLQAVADLTWIVLGPGDAGTSTVGAIDTAKKLAEELPLPLSEMAADDVQRRRLFLLRDAVRGARDLSGRYVPSALGITIGFNSLDGD